MANYKVKSAVDGLVDTFDIRVASRNRLVKRRKMHLNNSKLVRRIDDHDEDHQCVMRKKGSSPGAPRIPDIRS